MTESTAELAAERSLATHLVQKGHAMRAAAVARPTQEDWDEVIEARCVADDHTGVRKLAIREFSFLGDGGADIGGWNLGPSSPEYLLGVISTCLTHTFLCLAAMRDLPLDRVEVRVQANNNDAGFFGVSSDRPTQPHDIRIHVELEAPTLSAEERRAFIAEAEATCPVVKALREPQSLTLVSG